MREQSSLQVFIGFMKMGSANSDPFATDLAPNIWQHTILLSRSHHLKRIMTAGWILMNCEEILGDWVDSNGSEAE